MLSQWRHAENDGWTDIDYNLGLPPYEGAALDDPDRNWGVNAEWSVHLSEV
jgi:hypothetical protein